ncbi:MAG: hypothetical protein HUU31_25100 [Anaerolineae bacterium]|nr:hypothetical protein [Anaerolineae bacterium]
MASAANCWRGLARVATAEENAVEADGFYCRALRIQAALAQRHSSYGRVLKFWRDEHRAMLQRFGIESQCANEFTSEAAAPDAPSTLPREVVETFASNTVAVCTGVPEKRDEWREALTGIRADFAKRGADWAAEVAFVEALIAIVNGGAPVLPAENPYAGVVRQVVEAVRSGEDGKEKD